MPFGEKVCLPLVSLLTRRQRLCTLHLPSPKVHVTVVLLVAQMTTLFRSLEHSPFPQMKTLPTDTGVCTEERAACKAGCFSQADTAGQGPAGSIRSRWNNVSLGLRLPLVPSAPTPSVGLGVHHVHCALFTFQGLKNQARVKLNIVRCPPVTTVLIRRPDLRYQLGFSVQNGIVSTTP